MRTIQHLSVCSALMLVAGCATEQPGYVVEPGYSTPPPSARYNAEPIHPPAVNLGEGVAAAAAAQNDADQQLASSVRNQFDRYGDLSGLSPNIHIVAHNGVVTLTGSVPGQREREMVDALVRNSPGVVQVNNLLHVADPRVSNIPPTGATSRVYPGEPGDMAIVHVQTYSDRDWALAQGVAEGLRTTTVPPTSRPVEVYVANGRVTLRGVVDNERQRQGIVAAALRAAGPGNVTNELLVRP